MASRPETWPRCTSELLPNTLFKLASRYPDLVYSEYPRSNDVLDGYRKITYREVANAVHAVAWWLEEKVGKPAKEDGSETLVYMGPNDLRYAILVLGSVMTGYKVRIQLALCQARLLSINRCSSPRRATEQEPSQLSSPKQTAQ